MLHDATLVRPGNVAVKKSMEKVTSMSNGCVAESLAGVQINKILCLATWRHAIAQSRFFIRRHSIVGNVSVYIVRPCEMLTLISSAMTENEVCA